LTDKIIVSQLHGAGDYPKGNQVKQSEKDRKPKIGTQGLQTAIKKSAKRARTSYWKKKVGVSGELDVNEKKEGQKESHPEET